MTITQYNSNNSLTPEFKRAFSKKEIIWMNSSTIRVLLKAKSVDPKTYSPPSRRDQLVPHEVQPDHPTRERSTDNVVSSTEIQRMMNSASEKLPLFKFENINHKELFSNFFQRLLKLSWFASLSLFHVYSCGTRGGQMVSVPKP